MDVFCPSFTHQSCNIFVCLVPFIASYRQSIEEELPAGQPITTVSATDADQQDTLNSEIIYSITDILGFDTVCLIMTMVFDFTVLFFTLQADDVMNHFMIDQVSGEILTNTTLDYESVRSYRITVVASDIGEPQRSRYAPQYDLDVL